MSNESPPPSLGAILGSAFASDPTRLAGFAPVAVETSWGEQILYRREGPEVGDSPPPPPAFVAFRHGLPHQLLPHQIDVRCLLAAFREVGCQGLLVTSSVGVLDSALPLHRPLLLEDLLTLDNRLPDGTACTMWPRVAPDQGHLILAEGVFSPVLAEQLRALADARQMDLGPGVVFGYCPGPRTKTRAENRMWARLGAQVNSMTLAPEVILANELGIPCVGLVVGHKYSLPDHPGLSLEEVGGSLEQGRGALEALVGDFLREARPVPSGNSLYRFEARTHPEEWK